MQERRDVEELPQDVVVTFDTNRNLRWHRAVLPAIARLLSIRNHSVIRWGGYKSDSFYINMYISVSSLCMFVCGRNKRRAVLHVRSYVRQCL